MQNTLTIYPREELKHQAAGHRNGSRFVSQNAAKTEARPKMKVLYASALPSPRSRLHKKNKGLNRRKHGCAACFRHIGKPFL